MPERHDWQLITMQGPAWCLLLGAVQQLHVAACCTSLPQISLVADSNLGDLHFPCDFDLAGLIPDIVDAFPEVEVAGSKVAMMYLQGLTNRDMRTKVMKGGDVLDLGAGEASGSACKLVQGAGLGAVRQIRLSRSPRAETCLTFAHTSHSFCAAVLSQVPVAA